MSKDGQQPSPPGPVPQLPADPWLLVSPWDEQGRIVRPHRGGVVYKLGIGSLAINLLCFVGAFMFPPVCVGALISLGMAVAAIVMGAADLNAMRARQMKSDGQGMTRAGVVYAVLTIVLTVVELVVAVIAGAVALHLFQAYFPF